MQIRLDLVLAEYVTGIRIARDKIRLLSSKSHIDRFIWMALNAII